ncbi:MAG: hypothetical protein Q8Q62_01645 [Mesorhizobium sp.]|nr:hypothetical protein [Mesorhizobium sp.]
MDRLPENASVTVDRRDGEWIVTVTEGATIKKETFANEERAADFAHGERLRLGIVPQQDVS